MGAGFAPKWLSRKETSFWPWGHTLPPRTIGALPRADAWTRLYFRAWPASEGGFKKFLSHSGSE